MKSTWFNDRRQFDFCRLIEDAGGGGMRFSESFRSFLVCASSSIQQGARRLAGGQLCPNIEADYMREAGRMADVHKFAEAMAILTLELELKPRDFLGDCYQALGMADKEFAGQCFTPFPLCQMMAEVTLGECAPNKHHRLRLAEPAVGGGAMVIASTEVLKARGFRPTQFFWWCTDVAETCWRMAYIQLSMLGVPAWIIKGNSLCPKDSDTAWLTPVGAMFPPRHKETGEEVPPPLTSELPVQEVRGGQLVFNL